MGRRSIRFRIALAATLIVALATVAGAAVFVVILNGALREAVLSSARADAAAIATRIEQAGLSTLDTDDDAEGSLYQVVDVSGTVLQASDNARGDSLASQVSNESRTITLEGEEFIVVTVGSEYEEPRPTPVPSVTVTVPATDDDLDDDSDGDSGDDNENDGGDDSDDDNSGKGNSDDKGLGADVELSAHVTSAAESYVIVAGRSTETAAATITTVVQLLTVAVPLLVILIAASSWFAVARALRPVDRMRAELDEVTSANLHSRIEQPAARDEIGRLATTMNRMLERLDLSQQAQRRFVSDASHELKSPLASLRQYAEVASAHPDRISKDELSEAVLDEGARLERLVQGMLVLARADEQTLVGGTSAVDLDDIVLAEARRVKVAGRVSVDSSAVGPARVTGEPGMLSQVVRNLVDNAARHASTTVALSLVERGTTVELTVDDDGSGIAIDQREAIFDRFVRLDEARARESGGSGLGLSIVRELIAAHHGTIAVGDSALGGARFVVTLPTAG